MKKVHLIGIGGTGLSAIARLLIELGYIVTGSDRVETPFVQELRSAGATIYIGHRAENISNPDVVVRSSAVPDDNLEVIAARAANIPVLKRADFLGELMTGRTNIAVAGTHGKTTTTAMIAWILTELKCDPSFIVGGVLNNLGVNAHAGQGDAFVIEADEYDHMFLGLKPDIEVITNVEYDHPDCFPAPKDFYQSFVEFVKLLPQDGKLVISIEDKGSCALALEAEEMGNRIFAYSLQKKSGDYSQKSKVYTTELHANEMGGSTFVASVLGQSSIISLQIPGKHNILNALAALTVTVLLGLPINKAATALGNFAGTGRRFEVRGEIGGIIVIDDYAHHPTEIRATLAAARMRYPARRIVTIWQPHTYSRTKMFFEKYTSAFSDADEVIVTEIYPAREPRQDYSAKTIASAIPQQTQFIAEIPEVIDYLISHLHTGDVVVVLSAGDADTIGTQVLLRLKESEAHNE